MLWRTGCYLTLQLVKRAEFLLSIPPTNWSTRRTEKPWYWAHPWWNPSGFSLTHAPGSSRRGSGIQAAHSGDISWNMWPSTTWRDFFRNLPAGPRPTTMEDRKSTRLNSSHLVISYA